MRNAIKYYYNIDVDEIRFDNQCYLFDNYMLKEIKRDINIELYNFLISNNVYLYQIVNNIDNQSITKIENRDYVLLRINNDKNTLSLEDIVPYLIDINFDTKKDWSILWEKKVDYYEKNIMTTIDKNILEIFPYYIGLSELAIRIYKENEQETSLSVSHNRLISPYDLYSPDNIMIDYKVRDIAEYIKTAFFSDNLQLSELIISLEKIYLKPGDYILLYSRLLFPTYFFDCLENNQDISIYSSKINQYEDLLNKLYSYFLVKTVLPKIEWLIKR